MKVKVRWINSDILPRKSNGVIDFLNCVGITLKFNYDNKVGNVYISKYNSSKRYFTVIIGENEYELPTLSLVNCNFGKILGTYTKDFKIKIGTQFKDDKRDLTITDREYRSKEQKPDKKGRAYTENKKYYKYTCNKCGWTEGWIEERSLKKGKGCSCCIGKTVTPMNNIWDNARWMCDLGISEYDARSNTRGSSNKITVKCPDCGKEKKMIINNIYKYKSICCACGDGSSYISKYIINLLTQLNIKFDTEVKYEWNKYINPLNNKLTQASIDFVIYYKDREIPLEADGGFHRQNNRMNGQTKEMSEYIDKQRDENCLKYLGEETIRISDEGDVKENILNSKLNELFDLSNIDWLKCEEFALKNIVKEVCDYWNNKEEWETTQTISNDNVWGIKCRTTTIKYLKKGTKLGWCNYDPKKEMIRNGLKNGKSKGKKVEIFKDGVSLGVFESCAELSRQSEELFEVKLSRSMISRVCSGKLKQYKSYEFKYI